MNILNFVKSNLDKCNMAQLNDVSVITKVPMPTLIRVKYSRNVDPRISTIQPLYDHFQKRIHKKAA